MTRDYKNFAKGADEEKSRPGFLVGMLVGLLIGLIIAASVAWYIRNRPSPFVAKEEESRSEVTRSNANGKIDQSPVTEEKPKFDFYKILPGTEEVQPNNPNLEKPAGQKPQFFLQAGAFQNATEADNLKARLALMGVEAQVQTTTLVDKGTLHRVRVGPYSGIDDIHKVRALLAQNGIETSLVKDGQ